MRDYIARGGSNFHKWKQIDQKVYDEFCEWKHNRLIVHDRDLLESALIAAEEFNALDFKVCLQILFPFMSREFELIVVFRRVQHGY